MTPAPEFPCISAAHMRWTIVLVLLGLVGSIGLVPTASAQSSPVPEETPVEKIAGGFEFTEGPFWHEGRLLFTDIPANTVYEWTPADSSSSVFLKPSGHANGLAVGPQGHLLLAQHDGQVGRLTEGEAVEPVDRKSVV